MEACVVDGTTTHFGATALLHHIKNPILLAREIHLAAPFQCLVGSAAEEFAMERGLQMVPQKYFFTQERWKQHQDAPDDKPPPEWPTPLETVGAVALDLHGCMAAGTSTGGLNNKWDGRIGDTPVLGAASWAQHGIGAISATGNGEHILRVGLAKEIVDRVKYSGQRVRNAAQEVIQGMEPGTAGCIAMDQDGQVSMVMNTAGMYRGYMGMGMEQPIVNLFADEDDHL